MIDITYKPAEQGDVAAIAGIHVVSWRDAYASILSSDFLAGPIEVDRSALWTERLSNPPINLLVETAQGPNQRILGFIAAYFDHDLRWGSLVDNLHVLPEVRGLKIGENLLRSIARQLQARGEKTGLHLWVFEANHAGLRFYQRLGGAVVESEASNMPAANGQKVLRVYWRQMLGLI